MPVKKLPIWIPVLDAIATFFSCEPLAGLFGLGLWLLSYPIDSYGPLHELMFKAVPAYMWGLTMLAISLLGYYNIRKGGLAWKISMVGAVASYFVLMIAFSVVNGVAGPIFSFIFWGSAICRLTNLWQPVQGFRKHLGKQ